MNTPHRLTCLFCSVLILAFTANAADTPVPLPRAHSHNDYEHPRPLLDALSEGFCSVEADIYLVEGRLLVAHDRKDARPERTLESLYLEPLRQRVIANKGRVFPNGPPITLLIDLKSEAAATYAVLAPILDSYSDVLTAFTAAETKTNAVTVILSGNRPRELLAAEALRYAAYDGRIDDLTHPEIPASFIPLISESWGKLFKWNGRGAIPAAERERLRQLVRDAHQQGRRIRFWGTPDSPSVWEESWTAGVDLINTDRLKELREFSQSRTVK
jgi:hypothetical protein